MMILRDIITMTRNTRQRAIATHIPRYGVLFVIQLLVLRLVGSNGWIATTGTLSRPDTQLWYLGKTGTSSTRQNSATPLPATRADTETLPTAAGLPKELNELSLFESLDCDINTNNDSNRKCTVERVSMNPPIYILRNALTPDQCKHIREAASTVESEQGKTVTCKDDDDDENQQNQPRKFSRVGWLDNDTHLVEGVARAGHGIFLNTMPFHATRGIEPLQVVHYYDVGGEYINHHDDNNRLLTVLYYLNGVGETWFPLADNYDGPVLQDSIEANEACRDMTPNHDGVLVTCRDAKHNRSDTEENDRNSSAIARVQEGDAVAFYNYNMDGTKNWNALHSGLPVTEADLMSISGNEKDTIQRGGKWIANHWYHFVPAHIDPTPPPQSQ